jgi:chemotaxis methyl-accepting protein methylase
MAAAMNQYQDLPQFTLSPDLSPAALRTTLARLLVPGVIVDRKTVDLCRRLDERFRTFAATCPAPEWAPGLRLTAEIRSQYELYLPVGEIRAALDAFCKRACRYEPFTATTAIAGALSWPDALARLQPLAFTANPARILQRLASSEEFRCAFLAALFIPKSFGGSFDRYPLQADFFRGWLAGQRQRLAGSIAILDVACGSGEGTYAAAAAVLECGFSASASLVAGSTLEPLELAAAAHGWFPLDKARAAAFREQVHKLLASGAGRMIRFSQEDICKPWLSEQNYDVIFCNGLLGGPLLHGKGVLARTIALLAQRLRPGGILLAADRFHGGWQQKTPPAALAELLAASGLQMVAAGEGLAAVKSE